MNLLPKTKDEFAKQDYWDTFFKKRGNKSFEWYGEYPELCEHLHKYIKMKDNILIVGCGNSTLGNDLHDVGYKKIINIDISHVVIKQMINLNEKLRPSMKFIHMNALDMNFEDNQFSIVLDKGTLDALMPGDKNETLEKINTYFKEINRVLKTTGKYVIVSLLQKHILRKILEYFLTNNWGIKIIRCHEAETKNMDISDNNLPVFMIVCSKLKAASPVFLEISLGTDNKFIKYETINEVMGIISGIQEAAFVCTHLKNTSIANEEHISFDLFESENSKPRFTVFIADVKPERGNSPYAAFIVPQGREAEWLFSTSDGRLQLTRMTKNNRLVIITMHRDQKYGTLEDVKQELNDVVKNFAPANAHKIPFLSLGSDVGNRVVRHKGNSKYSGDYIIEDVEIDETTKYRRLYYLQSQLVIQSEARLKTVKSRRGHPKDVVNPLYLTCKHHLHMSLASHLACFGKSSPVLTVIGLGGGGLCTFLRKLLPAAAVKAVDIDEDMLKIATDWFGFTQDEKMSVQISEGVEFLNKHAEEEHNWDAILFDVDSKDTTIGMSCPPKQFLEERVLNDVTNLLNDTGVFILNMVLRDLKLRDPIIKKLKANFNAITSYKLEEDLNEVIVCFKQKLSREKIIFMYKNSCKEINKFLKTNGLPVEEQLMVNEYINNLNVDV